MGILRWEGLYESTRSANWPQIFPELIISGFQLNRMQLFSYVSDFSRNQNPTRVTLH